MIEKIWVKCSIFLALCVIVILILPALGQTSNCGGNSYARSMCDGFVKIAVVFMLEESDLTIRDLTKKDIDLRMGELPTWGVEDFWIFSPDKPIRECKGPVIICANEFGNVPQPSIWNGYSENPAHAVGTIDYKMISTTPKKAWKAFLISPDEYKNIDKKEYIKMTVFKRQNDKRVRK